MTWCCWSRARSSIPRPTWRGWISVPRRCAMKRKEDEAMQGVLEPIYTGDVPATARREERWPMKQVVVLTDVRKIYDGTAAQVALDGITLSIAEGEFTAVMGASGS